MNFQARGEEINKRRQEIEAKFLATVHTKYSYTVEEINNKNGLIVDESEVNKDWSQYLIDARSQQIQ